MTRNHDALDVLVLGSGVAGLSAAVRLADAGGRTGRRADEGRARAVDDPLGAGGVAAVLSDAEDSADLHLADTLRAGAGLCDPAAVRVLVDEVRHG